MKLKYIITALTSLGVCFSSCSDFLNQVPLSNLSEGDYYKAAEDFTAAVNGAYSTLQEGALLNDRYVFAEIPSDNTHEQSSGTVSAQDGFDEFYLTSENGNLSNIWNTAYRGINRANTVLGRIDKVEMDATLTARYKLEMKFIRAYLYFDLVRVFGDVPLVLKEVSISESLNVVRDSKEDVYAQIIADLKEVIADIPESYDAANSGRATKGSARALLGDIYMTTHKYSEAETILGEIVNSGKYALLENTAGSLNRDGYEKVFDPNNHNSSEAVFEIQFKKGGYGEGFGLVNTYAPGNSGTNVVTVGGTGDNNLPDLDIWEAFEENDLRREWSMALGYYDSRYDNRWTEATHIRKYRDTPHAGGDSNNNYPVYRYADVLLMYSEALNENGKLSDAIRYLNMTRRRGFGYQSTETTPVDLAPTSQAEFRLAVEQERRVELAFENKRWFDLIRTGRAVEVMKSKGHKLNETNLICPIPQAQIDLNDKLTENTYNIEPR
ncbi:MAG: RagB/SusD family nutrient uptake outer membrane protein [Tannerellaceae bacterium]|jgi:tetratricopeptide (TPR) repeat protein|nr:RagB/SusD family nutrient uptake outer membrane protein [Tannerellaceae bacterium]